MENQTAAGITAQYAGRATPIHESLTDAREILDGLVAAARRRDSELRKSAARHIAALRKRARARGYANGLRAAEISEADALLRMHALYIDTVRKSSADCLNLAVRLAEQLTQQAFQHSSAALQGHLEEALSDLAADRSLKIRVSTNDLAELRAKLFSPAVDGGIHFIEDPCMSPGNAQIETAAGTVEIDWREHLQQLKERLLGRIEEELAGAGTGPC